MISYVHLIFPLCVMVIVHPYNTIAQRSETQSAFDNISNQSNPYEILDDDSKILTSKYTADQINNIIYRLYEDIQKFNNTEIGQNQDIAFLIDLVCSNEFYENIVEACDIVTELPGVAE